MSDVNNWLGFGNIACLIPIVILFVQYVLRTNWKTTETGRALALLISLSFSNFLINFIGNLTDEELWNWTRVGVKFGIAFGLINLVRVMEGARHEEIVSRSKKITYQELKGDERRD